MFNSKQLKKALNRQTYLTAKIIETLSRFESLNLTSIANLIENKKYQYHFDEIRDALAVLVEESTVATFSNRDTDFYFYNVKTTDNKKQVVKTTTDSEAAPMTVNRIKTEIDAVINKNAFPIADRIETHHIFQIIFALALDNDFRRDFTATLDKAEENFFTNHNMWEDLM